MLRDATRTRPVAWRPLLRNTGLFSAGMALPFVLTCLILWRLGNLPAVLVLDVHLRPSPRGHYQRRKWRGTNSPNFSTDCGWVKWSLPWAAAGLVCLLREKDNADGKFILGTLLGFSLLAFAGGFYFSRHYFIVVLPVVSLLDRHCGENGGAGAGRGAAGGGSSGPGGAVLPGLRGFCFSESRRLVSSRAG